jgi:hypothetical protein
VRCQVAREQQGVIGEVLPRFLTKETQLYMSAWGSSTITNTLASAPLMFPTVQLTNASRKLLRNNTVTHVSLQRIWCCCEALVPAGLRTASQTCCRTKTLQLQQLLLEQQLSYSPCISQQACVPFISSPRLKPQP